ncbi:Fic family protein [Ramlibacter sp.]|uniref:Fic family protein n=1 Tax=Ramlibacter sp. TaxID=1917967 RepID=UPI0017E1D0EA|nr:Fic family protein [Ramlibacter sp.]MBA2675825.1 Fic family protein [Ramlibacter sp.]
MENLLEQCARKKAELDGYRPLAPDQEERILQKLRLEWDFHSNHLEGNSLSYGETKALILHGLTAQGKPLKDHFEITGHHEAVLWIEDLVRKREPLTESVVRQLHQLILKEDHEIEAVTADGRPTHIRVEVGRYKTSPNHVKTATGETLFFSSPMDTPIHMRELLDWYSANAGTTDAIELSSVFHHRFTRIHPFSDGNGRVARLLGNFILMMGSYPPVIVKTQEKDTYFAALRLADAGNPAAFAEYIAQRLLESLDLMIRGARGESVEEPDDVAKELALLKQQFQAQEQKVNVLRDKTIAEAAWVAWIEPLITEFLRRSTAFETFYLKRHAHILVNGAAGGTLDDMMQRAAAKIGSAGEIETRVEFAQFRTREHVSRNFTQSVSLRLLPTHTEVLNGARQKLAEVDWDHTPSKETLALWIAAEEKRHMAALKDLINKPT